MTYSTENFKVTKLLLLQRKKDAKKKRRKENTKKSNFCISLNAVIRKIFLFKIILLCTFQFLKDVLI